MRGCNDFNFFLWLIYCYWFLFITLATLTSTCFSTGVSFIILFVGLYHKDTNKSYKFFGVLKIFGIIFLVRTSVCCWKFLGFFFLMFNRVCCWSSTGPTPAHFWSGGTPGQTDSMGSNQGSQMGSILLSGKFTCATVNIIHHHLGDLWHTFLLEVTQARQLNL